MDATFWNDLADEYAAKPVENPDAFERKIRITQALMTPQDRVLDIGCGTGSLALRLAPRGGQLIGLDASSEMIRIARHKTAAQGAGNVTFHVGPWDDDAPFQDESLDGVCAYSFLHLVPDRRQALARIHRVLKPGGFFVSSTVVLGETWVPMSALIAVMRWVGKAPYVADFSKAELDQDLREVGFVDLQHHDVGQKATTAFVVARK